MEELTAAEKYRIECEVRIAAENKMSNMNKGLKPYSNKFVHDFDFEEVAKKVLIATTYPLQIEVILSILKGAESSNPSMKYALEKVWKSISKEKYTLEAEATPPSYITSLDDIKQYMMSFDEEQVIEGMIELCIDILHSIKLNETDKLGAKLNKELIPIHLRNKYNKLAKEDIEEANRKFYFLIPQGEVMVKAETDSNEVLEFLSGIDNGVCIHGIEYLKRNKQRS